ncbi:MAG: agmatine deiminase family protein [Thermoplasmata archaeon]|jgi:agmatine deiminase
MPAEWAPHAATWVVWPHRPDDWPGRFGAIPFAFAEIIRHLVPHESVRIVVGSASQEAQARALLENAGVDLGYLRFFRWRTDRSWVRDSGPIFVRNDVSEGTRPIVGVIDWRFNAWAKYEDWHRDNRLPSRVAREFDLPVWRPRVEGTPIVLEGGAIDGNGAGTVLATEECLLGEVQARNPGLDRTGVERVLSDYLGCDRVVWLPRGIVGDDTHGHIDDVARFVGERTVVVAREPDASDPNHSILEENLECLRAATDSVGRPFEVVELPMPAPLAYGRQRVPASYLNFYIANEVVLVPTFNDAADRTALGVLENLFPGRTVTGIHSGDLIWGLGSIHCLTQQEPLA